MLPLKKSIFQTEWNSLWDEKKENRKPNSLIQTLAYRSNIYYFKIYQRGNWKNNSSTLHLEVHTRYFRHRYSIKLSLAQTSWFTKKGPDVNNFTKSFSHISNWVLSSVLYSETFNLAKYSINTWLHFTNNKLHRRISLSTHLYKPIHQTSLLL